MIKMIINGPLVYQERNIYHNFHGVKAFKRIKITHFFFFLNILELLSPLLENRENYLFLK